MRFLKKRKSLSEWENVLLVSRLLRMTSLGEEISCDRAQYAEMKNPVNGE